jgi:hypothetical protein
MNRQQQLIVTVAAVVLAAAIASVVTWLAVRSDDNGGGGSTGARSAALGGPPPDAQRIARNKKSQASRRPRRGTTAPRVGVGSQPQNCSASTPATMFVEWKESPKNLTAARRSAQTVVLGQVTSVSAGQPLVIRAKGEPGGAWRVPTTLARLRVAQSYKGSNAAGSTVTVSQLGDACHQVANDPLYRAGTTELLMLRRGPGGTLQTVAPEGRFRRGPGGTLDPVIDNRATRPLKDKPLSAVGTTLRQR